VSDDIIQKLIEFLEGYSFGEEDYGLESQKPEGGTMSPEILGYIFERTANHEAGSYYTPANVTEFIASGTLQERILDLFNSRLEAKGVPSTKRVENALVDGSLTKEELKTIYDEVKELEVLDPSCGSGSFFTSTKKYSRSSL
jgi:type I restriction-modification system DNA methylase subunit